MKTRFKGHETFFFREGWLSKALYEMHVNNNDTLFSGNNGIVKLGVGSNMVKSIKYWMLTSKLIKLNSKTRCYELTELGNIIAAKDVYLEDMFSLWILHLNIVRNFESATTWNLFFNEFKAEKFNANHVKDVLKTYLSSKEVSFAEKSLDTDINVLLNMYTKEKSSNDPEENYLCPFSRLGLLGINRNEFAKKIPDLNNIDELVILYAILLMIENDEDSGNYISISKLEEGENSLVNLMHFNRIIINEYLEQLANQSFIRIEKTAGLDMIYVTTELSSLDVVKMYFERRNLL